MKMKHAVVTGGAGFLGSHLVDYLLKKKFKVTCIDNFITGNPKNIEHLKSHPDFKLMEHDVTKHIQISEPVDAIFHFASPASPIDYQKIPIPTLKVGALGTHNALGLAKAKGATILLASTSEVYGDPLVHPQKENYWGNVNPIGPRGCYDEAKRFLEAITMAYHRIHKLKTRIVRIFNTYGPRQRLDDGRAVPTFLTQALKGEDITIFGKGSQTRSFCYVDDLIEGIYQLFLSDYSNPVNIGNPHEMTIKEMAQKIIALTQSKSKLIYKPLPIDDPKTRQPNIALAKKLLTWKPKINFETGISRSMKYFKERIGSPPSLENGGMTHVMNVPIINLKKQYAPIKKDILSAIDRVLDQGNYILGPEVEKLEKDLAQFCEVPYALGTSSGTDALLLSLLTIGLEPGDEVITTPYSFFATAEVISFLKGTPVFVDIDPETFCIDPAKIVEAVTPKTKAILPVHIFGQCADMDPILEIAKKHNLYVIEDACQAIGATYKGKKACSMGDLSTLSFYPTKNLGGYTDGGMLLMKTEEHFLSARDYRTHGEYPKKYLHKKIGMNGRMCAITGAILNTKYPYLETWNKKRQEKAQIYYALCEEAGLLDKISLPKTASYNTHIYHLYVVLTDQKAELSSYLKSHGIQTGNFYPKPMYALDCYKHLNYSLPITEKICQKSLALPICPEITLEEQSYVVSKIKDFYKKAP